MKLDFHPVTADRWGDFAQLFESKGGPHNCWCMVWRNNENRKTIPGKVGKKSSMKNRVDQGIPVGLLAYSDNEPIAWCSIAPRDTYKSLGGDETKDCVWSLACFFIKRTFRNMGITSQLLTAAIDYAKENGAQYVEAYPVAPDSPSYRFMGFVSTFEKAGFQFVKSAGSRRNVMLLPLT
ncbi:GNAT family N-acetyltransferase [Vacuolonema iberomarrocanum]|uniref:GNAT family N-acetyltransferase n=1 Tax=Vacuolonema iberomarrocanum TaxID=3454632 RepID=UPI0019F79B27|nr:GNAT family N-acetyltransferase [filamentous cyanobacterium LEGE 07170]